MGDVSGAMTVALIAIGAVALFAALFYILFAGTKAQADRTDAHMHEDVVDNEAGIMDVRDRVDVLEAAGSLPAAAPVAAPPVDAPSADSYVESVVQRILDATTPDERSAALADIISKALSKEELSAVVAGISPMTGTGGSVSNMTDLERLKELAKILKDGDVPAGLAMTGGSSSSLSALYEAVVNSLVDSPVISDQTRTLLSYIKMQKCQRDFASDPAKLTACLTAVPAAGGTSTAPAAGGTTPSTTAPGTTEPLQTAPTVVTDMTVLADGLTVKTATGSTAKFTFDQNRLTVCADASCKSTALF